MSIKLQIDNGFEKLLKDIEAAGRSVDSAVDSALRESAKIMETTLKSEMQKAGVNNALINKMPPFEVSQNGNKTIARVGYKKGAYDPENPSDGYKVVFLNYGTPNGRNTMAGGQRVQINGEWVTLDKERGIEPAKGFIKKAQTKARPQINKQQKQTLEKILSRLKGE